MDISPFPLNSNDTKINYSKNKDSSKKLNKKQYQQLVEITVPTFFELKIKEIADKKSPDIMAFLCYSRVKSNFGDNISKVLIDYKIVNSQNDIGDISQQGGGINKAKLKEILEKSMIR